MAYMKGFLIGAVLLLPLGACKYAPQPPSGQMACAPSGACPKGYYCAANQTCVKNGEDPDRVGSQKDAGDDTGEDPDAAQPVPPLEGSAARDFTVGGRVQGSKYRMDVQLGQPFLHGETSGGTKKLESPLPPKP